MYYTYIDKQLKFFEYKKKLYVLDNLSTFYQYYRLSKTYEIPLKLKLL